MILLLAQKVKTDSLCLLDIVQGNLYGLVYRGC